MSSENILKQFNKWKKENDQQGRQAFSRFIMLKFLDGINELSDEFVFKGGNLLWHYIKTPRQTIDLDLSTINLNSHIKVKNILDKAAKYHSNIVFNIKEFEELKKKSQIGAAVIIEFKTNTGQKNQFTLDVLYSLPTDISRVKSTTSDSYYQSASIENIVTDKMLASYKFKSGNTRMKDFDDLWRISQSGIKLSYSKLIKLMKLNNIKNELDTEWIQFLEDHWKRHSRGYKDLPRELTKVFGDINNWLFQLKRE